MRGSEIKQRKKIKIQITIYKWLSLMYNINIIKVKENLIKFLIKFLEVN